VRPSVLVVSNLLSRSVGVRAQAEELIERLSACGHSVVATSEKLHRVPRLVDMLSTTWLHRNDYEVAIVDVFSGAAFFWAECVCRLLRLARKPCVLCLHGGNLPEFTRGRQRRTMGLMSSAAAVVAPSAYLFEHMRKYRSDLLLIPNAVNFSDYYFRVRETVAPNLVWLRAFHKIYNPILAVEVMYRLKREFPTARLSMIGPDKGDGSLEATKNRIAELGLTECISVHGRVPKNRVPETLKTGDIFLNTSNIDNTPITVLEAMAAGLCVVSTNVGGMPKLVNNEREGILVPPADPDAMAVAVRRILKEPGLAERLSKNAGAKTLTFDWSAVTPRWTELLASVCVPAVSGPRWSSGCAQS